MGVALRAVSCSDEQATARAVEAILDRCGFEIVGRVGSAVDAVIAAGLASPHVVVLDLALTGDLGLGAVRAVRVAAPHCEVIVVSSFDTLRPAALAAGAFAFVGAADLRDLERSLERFRAAARDGAAPDVQDGLAASDSPAATVAGRVRRKARST